VHGTSIVNVALVFSDILQPATEKEDKLRDGKVRQYHPELDQEQKWHQHWAF
jgi:hypothetical protein